MEIGIASVAAITVICYLVGLIVKASGLNDKYIPICCGVAGAVLGLVGLGLVGLVVWLVIRMMSI